MTPQEQTMLSGLIDRVNATQLPEKDPEAEQLLQQRLGANPNALYVLAQTVLVQKYALDQAKAQLDQLRSQSAQASQPEHKTSFLGSLFGHRDEPQTPPAPPRQFAPSAAPGNYPPQAAYTARAGYPPPPSPAQPGYAPQPSGGGSSFLRSAATTAAGVAAGALAVEGIDSLLHGFGHSAGFGGGGFLGGGGFGAGAPAEETVINNYYDQPGAAQGFDTAQSFDAGNDDSGDQRLQQAQDLSQQGAADLTPQLDQASDVNVTDDQGGQDLGVDATSYDDPGNLDSGGMDSGGIDDGGGFGGEDYV